MSKLFILVALVVLCTLFITALADNKQAGIDWLAKKEHEEGVIKHSSGLLYKVLTPGTGSKKPSATSRVTVHYEGTLITGEVFDSSKKRGETITFGLNQVIKCWTLAVQDMVIGAKHEIYCPQELAYGPSGAGGLIKPFSALIFEVELFAIDGKKDEL